MSGQTLYDKVWALHAIPLGDDGEAQLYIDLHLLHEISTPQAFEGLRLAARGVRRPDRAIAVMDHNIPTTGQERGLSSVTDPAAQIQLATLRDNVVDAGIEHYLLGDRRNGIVHVVAPEQGRSLPGMTIACGDSHTSTHGAFGALAFGIGTSQVEQILATQTVRMRKLRNMRVTFDGEISIGVTAKDMALALISRIGTGGGTGYAIEYAGPAVRALSMEARMTLCNLTIEAGSRAGMIAPDETTLAYLRDREMAPKGAAWEVAAAFWTTLRSDVEARFDREITIDVSDLPPLVTWGTSPQDVVAVDGHVPLLSDFADPLERSDAERAMAYMGVQSGQAMIGLCIDRVFIGSCTNSRIEDLRAAAAIVRGRKVAAGVEAMVVPGSGAVMAQAEAEGLDAMFRAAGFEWRQPGCSMCLGMNADRLRPGERCASTSNRNFQGRQGRDGRTHLMSPAMAAAAAVTGRLVDVREFTA